MWRMVAFGVLSVTSIVAAGWVYQVHHIVVVNFDLWPTLKAIRDLSLICVALIWLFYPSRAVIAVAMAAVFIVPALVSLNPPNLFYVAASLVLIAASVLVTQLRRGLPSAFTTNPTETAD